MRLRGKGGGGRTQGTALGGNWGYKGTRRDIVQRKIQGFKKKKKKGKNTQHTYILELMYAPKFESRLLFSNFPADLAWKLPPYINVHD